jgi:hypothetical protein
VTSSVGARAAALAGVALVAVAIALAYSVRGNDEKTDETQAAGAWYAALAAPYVAPAKRKSACGVVIGAGTAGVAHPVLPCGVKLYVRFHGKTVLTQVIDRGHTVPGRDFDFTPALAKLLRLQGTQRIEWRFAR